MVRTARSQRPTQPMLTVTQLLGLYMIIAVAFWVSPPDALDNVLTLLRR